MKNFTINTVILLALLFGITNLTNAQWTQIGQDIDGEEGASGSAVSLNADGTVVAIGAPCNGENGIDAGQVAIYKFNSGNWLQMGNDLDGDTAVDNFGKSVCLSSDGTILAIGAYRNDGNGNDAGHVKVYEYNGSNWIQLGNNIEGEAAGDNSGISVSLNSDGKIVAIGALYNDGSATNSGHVRIFEYSGGNWIQMGSDIDGEGWNNNSGRSVSLSSDGSIVAIGAITNDGNSGNSNDDRGHVRIYEYSGGNWIQVGNDIDGENAGDWSRVYCKFKFRWKYCCYRCTL